MPHTLHKPFALLTLVLAAGTLAWSRPSTAAKLPAKAGNTGPAPLLDRELFFGNPEIAAAQLSPDGKYLAFMKPWKDTRNIWVKRVAEPFDAARRLTAEAQRPIAAFFWSRDSQYVLFSKDNQGDENFNIYAVRPSDAAAPGQDVPPARNLTDAKRVRALIYALPKKMPNTLFIGLNDRDPAWHDLYRLNLTTGERTLLRQNTERISAWIFDLDGQLRLAMRTAENGDTEILRVDASGLTKVYSCNVFETCGPVQFHKDGKRIYMETNQGNVDLIRLILFNPATSVEEVVESDPNKRVDFGSAYFSEATDELVATSYEDDRTQYHFRNKKWAADYRWLSTKLAGKEIHATSTTADDQRWLIAAQSDTEPGEVYLFDRRTKKLTLQYQVRERLPRAALASAKPVRYPSSDGLEIPAYLTLPRGVAPKDLPLLMVPHGGPWGRDTWGFHNLAQFLANRGYAVLQPNFRGSTGYGKKFLNAGNKEWGQRMQDDITWGVKYLVGQGIADPKRVGIMGGSYGGYATLAGVAFTPDVYAAAVSVVGPSNLITLLESIPPYWESIRTLFHERMGNPKTPEGKAQLERQSPLFSAQKIRTPLMVVQGANDPRVNKAESDQIVIALRDRGFPVEYIVAPDEGHGFQRPINNMALFTAVEAFLNKHLKGRFQEDAPPEVSQRLKEITVDPKTVVLAPKIDPAKVTVPQLAATLKPGTARYQAKIQAPIGPAVTITTTRTIKADGDTWVVTEASKTPGGDAVDTTVLDKKTLVVRKRNVTQGPVAIDIAFEDHKAAGKMAIGGVPKPIAVELGGPLFADGAGAHEVLATLPLADGYSTLYRNFDLQKQKTKLKQVKVIGHEEIKGPSGTLKTWKLAVTSAEGEAGETTVWVAEGTRAVVKVSATLPQLGGATITSELQP